MIRISDGTLFNPTAVLRSGVKGTISELRAAAKFAAAGYNVLWPGGDGSRYDFAIERDGIFQRVEVKTVRHTDGSDRRQAKTGRNRGKEYELLVAVDMESEDVWVMPGGKALRQDYVTLYTYHQSRSGRGRPSSTLWTADCTFDRAIVATEPSSFQKGYTLECLACAFGLHRGWHVSAPVEDTCPYDFNWLRKGEALRIEVRTAYPHHRGEHRQVNTGVDKGKKYDRLLAMSNDSRDLWMIPWDVLDGRSGVYLSSAFDQYRHILNFSTR